jgi:putative phosphoribosyl transferase
VRFSDRADAGRQLGERLARLDLPDPIVLGLPRGGVAVAAEAARILRCPLDVLVVRKIGVPGQPEFALGALAGEDPPWFNVPVLDRLGLTAADLMAAAERERAEVRWREARYREGRAAPEVDGKSVIVTDDGVATGATARAALAMVRRRRPARLVLAAPVCAAATAAALREFADEVVCLRMPADFRAVGQWYEDFAQVSDDDVSRILRSALSLDFRSFGLDGLRALLAGGRHAGPSRVHHLKS